MPLLSEKDRAYLQDMFNQQLIEPVKVLYFFRLIGCDYCDDTRMILREVSELSDKIEVEEHNIEEHKELAEKYGVDKVPAIVILRGSEGDSDYGIRFFGIPSGYEFTSLIEAIIHVSRGETDLQEGTKKELSKIDRPVHIQVFITPTCPYCPRAVVLAHKMAIESDNIRADMIESIEFPDLANHYRVYAVPKIVVNDVVEFEGALPEPQFLEKVMEVLERTEA
ncbi:MAG: glutaredoxin [Candidatus Hydrothermota bacterium]|nr:MAG: glutaredoxin [Candidatus Hydrothermae bacterium]